jgi:hypothetical protein
MGFTHRVATTDDLVALETVMDAAIGELQKGFLSPEEIESSRAIMGIDTQLIKDGTYYVVLDGEAIAGCGGWSRRATLYGGDHTPGRDPELLDPSVDAAKVRAMYTNPAYARRGRGAIDPGPVPAGRQERGLHPPRAHGHDVRRAPLHDVRLHADRAAHR